MFETVIPLVSLAVDLVVERDVARDLYEEGAQVLDIRVDRPAEDLLESAAPLETVFLRTCDGEDLSLVVDQTLDVVGGFSLVLEPEVEVCGLMFLWSGPMEFVGFGRAGAFQISARTRRTAVRLHDGQGRGIIKRWRVTDGVVVDHRNLGVMVEVFRPEVGDEVVD